MELLRKSTVRRDGFTLIEVLVSIIILSIVLTVMLQLVSGALYSKRISGDYTQAVFYAREKMEEILLSDNLSEMILSGEFEDGYSWRVDIEYQRPEKEDEAIVQKPILDLFTVNVDIIWRDKNREKRYNISTIKIAGMAGEKKAS